MKSKSCRILAIILLFTIFNLIMAPLPAQAAEKVFFVHQDHLGSTNVVTDSWGNRTSQQVYYPYGNTRASQGDLPTERQYTSQVSDLPQTGLYYYNARYYNPSLAFFTQADTLNTSLNRYAYVNSNPIRFNDPTGHMMDAGEMGGGGSGSGSAPYIYLPTILKPVPNSDLEQWLDWCNQNPYLCHGGVSNVGGGVWQVDPNMTRAETKGIAIMSAPVAVAGTAGMAGEAAGVTVTAAAVAKAILWFNGVSDAAMILECGEGNVHACANLHYAFGDPSGLVGLRYLASQPGRLYRSIRFLFARAAKHESGHILMARYLGYDFEWTALSLETGLTKMSPEVADDPIARSLIAAGGAAAEEALGSGTPANLLLGEYKDTDLYVIKNAMGEGGPPPRHALDLARAIIGNDFDELVSLYRSFMDILDEAGAAVFINRSELP